jgi:AraC-like DNA-binding protein
MDALSEILNVVKLEGALFYNAEYSRPWCFRSPASAVICKHLGAADAHIIVYHLVTEGSAWARLEDGDPVPLNGGDIVVFPHGDAHLMGNGSPVPPADHGLDLQRIFAQGLSVARRGGGGEITKFVCGYMVCEPELSRVLLAGLPPLLKIHIRDDPAGAWLENSIRFSVTHAASSVPGSDAVLAKLSETLFAETLRRYVATLAPGDRGWLAGVRDPNIGKALAVLHREPGRNWTISQLAEEVGMSRSVLAERFREVLGVPPMSYLARWRLYLGSRLLATTARGVADIGVEVGYDSEAAFNRAFKRAFGVPPALYRRQTKDSYVSRSFSKSRAAEFMQ